MNAQKKNKPTQLVIKLTFLFLSLFMTSSELFAESEKKILEVKQLMEA
jgi:hypothetical protein